MFFFVSLAFRSLLNVFLWLNDAFNQIRESEIEKKRKKLVLKTINSRKPVENNKINLILFHIFAIFFLHHRIKRYKKMQGKLAKSARKHCHCIEPYEIWKVLKSVVPTTGSNIMFNIRLSKPQNKKGYEAIETIVKRYLYNVSPFHGQIYEVN